MRSWHLLLNMERSVAKASYRQILDGLADAIRTGRLAPGTALPGTRELAKILDVNRKTVVLAYEEAITKGWLTSEARRGTFVSERFEASSDKQNMLAAKDEFAPEFIYPTLPPYFAQPLSSTSGKHHRYMVPMVFDNGAPDHRLLKQAVLHRYYRAAMRTAFKSNWVRYGGMESDKQLRESLADMLRLTRGLSITPDYLTITQGTQMALHLAASAVIRPGDVVILERLSYPPAWTIFRLLGAEIVTVEVDQDGCRVDEIEACCLHRRVAMVYLTPHHQFPTTVSLRADRRARLLLLASRFAFTVIEEDYDHEYHFAGRPYLPLASDSRQRHVIYVGSLSKLLGSSFRCGFIVAPPNLTRVLQQKALLSYGQGDAVMQTMLADLIADGELKKHVRRSTRIYRARKDALCECLYAAFRGRVSIRMPEGGLTLWVRFDAAINVNQMANRATAQGLGVRGGHQFSPSGDMENSLRLGFASMNHDEIQEAVNRLLMASKA